jgi:preprotein translocase subunit YajC
LGYDAAGLDYLIGKRTQYYDRRQRNRTLKKGDRVAVLGRGIAVVEHVDSNWIQAVVWNKCELRIARKEIVWDEGNMRWETDASSVSQTKPKAMSSACTKV